VPIGQRTRWLRISYHISKIKIRNLNVTFLLFCFNFITFVSLTIYWLPTWRTDNYLIIKYYSPLHVSSLKCSSSGGYNCTHAAYGTVTLYESSWWPAGTQLEWELKLKYPRMNKQIEPQMSRQFHISSLSCHLWLTST